VKKVVIGAVAVLAVLIVVAAILPFAVDLNRYKGQILSRVRPAVHRDVDFDSINLTILTGLGAELEGLRVPENPSFAGDTFVTMDSVKVRIRILPLLKGQVRVARLVFKSPVVHVKRNAQGVFNYADMMPPKKEEEKESKLPAILASFGISDLTVRNGTITYEDRKPPAAPQPEGAPPAVKSLTVSNLDASIEDISVTDPISINISGSLLGGHKENFSLKGRVGPIGLDVKDSQIPVDVALALDALSLKGLTEGLGLATRAASGSLSGNIEAKGSVKGKLETVSKITVSDFVMARKPGAPALKSVQPAAIAFDGRVVYEGVSKDVVIQSANLGVNDSTFAITGKAQLPAGGPAWNIVVRSTRMDTGSLAAAASAFGVALPADLVVKGPARLQLTTTGTPKNMAFDTGVELSSAEIAKGGTFRKAPGVTLTLGSQAGIQDGLLTIRSLSLVLHNLALSGNGEVAMKEKPPTMNIRLASKPASLKGWDAMIPAMSNYGLGGDMAVKAAITGTTKNPQFSLEAVSSQLALTVPASKDKPGSKPTPVSLQGMNLAVQGRTAEKKLLANGTYGVKSGTYGQIALSNVSGSFNMAPGRIDVPSLSLGVFGGTVNGSAAYMTTAKDWTFNPTIKGINAAQAMNTLTSFNDVFAGTLSGKMQIRGSTAKKGLDSLATNGTITIDKGSMNNIDIVSSVVDGLTGVPGLTGLVAEKSAVQRNRQTQFDSLTTDFAMARKVLNVQSMKLSNIRTGKETNSLATMQGTVDLTTRKLGLKGNVVFSQEYSARLAKQTPALNALANEQRRIDLPIQITGTVTKPVLFLQTAEITKAVANYYTKKGVEKGLEKLKKKLNIPGGDSGSSQQDSGSGQKGAPNPLQDLFNGVLGK